VSERHLFPRLSFLHSERAAGRFLQGVADPSSALDDFSSITHFAPIVLR